MRFTGRHETGAAYGSFAMGYREKSAWVSLLATLFIYSSYFVTVFELARMGYADRGTIMGLFIGSVVLQTLVVGAMHILFAASGKSEAGDERDASIELRSSRNAYVVFSFCVWTVITALVFEDLIRSEVGDAIKLPTFLFAQVLLLSYFIAEVVRFATQVFFYRRR